MTEQLEKMRDRGLLAMRLGLRPGNNQVRLAVDLAYANAKTRAHRYTRQQQRREWVKGGRRKGISWQAWRAAR